MAKPIVDKNGKINLDGHVYIKADSTQTTFKGQVVESGKTYIFPKLAKSVDGNRDVVDALVVTENNPTQWRMFSRMLGMRHHEDIERLLVQPMDTDEEAKKRRLEEEKNAGLFFVDGFRVSNRELYGEIIELCNGADVPRVYEYV